MKNLNLSQIVAVLGIAFTLTSCGSTSQYPPNHPWWTGEPVEQADGSVVYLPQQTDGAELLVGEGDGEEPIACADPRTDPRTGDGTCLADSDQGRFAQGDPTGRHYRPLAPSEARR